MIGRLRRWWLWRQTGPVDYIYTQVTRTPLQTALRRLPGAVDKVEWLEDELFLRPPGHYHFWGRWRWEDPWTLWSDRRNAALAVIK